MNNFLPICKEDMEKRGWDCVDFTYVIGDAYVDHPSFGPAIISRVLEKAGYRVAMLCLPCWQDAATRAKLRATAPPSSRLPPRRPSR